MAVNTYSGREVIAVNGVLGCGECDRYAEPGRWIIECLEDIALNKVKRIENPLMFKPLCVEYGIYGVHFMDKIFGAEVYFTDGQWYSKRLNIPVGSLEFPDIESNDTWLLVKQAHRAFLDAGQGLALYGLPTVASPLVSAVNLFGEEILVTLLCSPNDAVHDLGVIAEVQKYIHRYFIDNTPPELLQPVISWNRTQAPGRGQICGCTNQLISSELYARHIAPLDDAVLGVYKKSGMMHLCGSHTQHIEAFQGMKNLSAVQINDRAARDLKIYYDELREDQIIYLNPCDSMSVDMAMEITGGRRLVIADNIDKAEYII